MSLMYCYICNQPITEGQAHSSHRGLVNQDYHYLCFARNPLIMIPMRKESGHYLLKYLKEHYDDLKLAPVPIRELVAVLENMEVDKK